MRHLRLVRIYSSRSREQFTLSEDKYEGWVILAAKSGTFMYTIDGEEESGSQTVEFGELVFCPPGRTLRRKALGPFSFHFIEFTGSFDFNPGKIRIRDISRLNSTFSYLQSWQDEEPNEGKSLDEAEHLVSDLLFMAERERSKRNTALSS